MIKRSLKWLTAGFITGVLFFSTLAYSQGTTYSLGQVLTVSSTALPASCTTGNLYLFTGTPAGVYFCSSTNTWTAVTGGGGNPVPGAVQDSYVESGCAVVWTTGLTFALSPGSAFINGVAVACTSQTVTLDAADPTNPRIDAFIIDNTGTFDDITGTAAATPSLPSYDPGSQLLLGFATVAAGATAPVVTDTLLYADNAGAPTEWDCTDSGTTFDCDSTANPRSPSTKNIQLTSAASGDYVQLQIGSGTFDPNTSRLLYCYVDPAATWANNNGLQISLRLSGVQVGSVVPINRTGSFGFNSASSVYQLIAIPIQQFAVPTGSLINQVRIAKFGSTVFTASIDDCSFQAGGASQVPVGITQAQADARYAPLPRTIGITVDGGGSALTTGVKGCFPIITGGTITSATLLADQTGSMVMDVWVDTYANYPPTDADSITASAPPTISSATKSQDVTLTGWTKIVGNDRTVCYNIDSAATITRATLVLGIQ